MQLLTHLQRPTHVLLSVIALSWASSAERLATRSTNAMAAFSPLCLWLTPLGIPPLLVCSTR